uniref:Cystatin domain-containing protein n=1 Tax=Heliothis virescens TaxID=7102 RepID=A0A2A4IXV2_HELVI
MEVRTALILIVLTVAAARNTPTHQHIDSTMSSNTNTAAEDKTTEDLVRETTSVEEVQLGDDEDVGKYDATLEVAAEENYENKDTEDNKHYEQATIDKLTKKTRVQMEYRAVFVGVACPDNTTIRIDNQCRQKQ